jgi:peptidoglycan/LPS O-acetylase OafA/YrhL
MGENRIERFYSLDVLRGVAALGVVLWHWQHFFFVGSRLGAYDASQAPLYSLAFIFYDKGWLGVDLFFSLSGFVFFWLYSARISEGSISTGRFAWLRFSRLYPLHLLTLCAGAWAGAANLRLPVQRPQAPAPEPYPRGLLGPRGRAIV